MKIETIENGIQITIEKKENYTLKELEQKLINYLYNLDEYTQVDIELIKILFR